MKRLLIINFVFVWILTNHVCAQTYITQVKDSTARWGYINLSGEMIIPAKFQKCFQFTNDIAIVFDDESKQYYFLNANGKRVKTDLPKFTIEGGYFSYGNSLFANGLLAVENGKWGYLDNLGKLAIPLQYDEASVFYGGYAIVKMKKNFFIIDVKGNKTEIKIQNIIEVNHFSENLASYKNAHYRIGFINSQGNVVIEAKFKSVGYFIGGVAWAKTFKNEVGFIDSTGNWVIQPDFDEAHNFDLVSGYARIKKGGKNGYIDKNGKIYYLDTDNYLDYKEGRAVGEKNNKFGFFDSKGMWVIPAEFEGLRSFKNGYAAAKLNSKWGIIDTDGQWIIEPQFYGIKDMELVGSQ